MACQGSMFVSSQSALIKMLCINSPTSDVLTEKIMVIYDS